MFLWNFHHLFLVLFYQWNNYNQVLITVSDFLGHFSKNHLLEGGYTFQWGVCFWIGGISRGMPQWHALDLMKGFSKKIMWCETTHPLSPLWETLKMMGTPLCQTTLVSIFQSVLTLIWLQWNWLSLLISSLFSMYFNFGWTSYIHIYIELILSFGLAIYIYIYWTDFEFYSNYWIFL